MADEPVVKKKKGRKRNYINNPELHEAMCDYIEGLNKNPRIKIPKYICEAITHIVTRYSCSPNFINYPFRDEMIGDAIQTCFQRIGNYNPYAVAKRGPNIGKPSRNPLAYFTQIAFHAFINRISIEKKQRDIKLKVAINEGRSIEFLRDASVIFGMDADQIDEYMIEHFEEKKERSRNYKGATLTSFFI